MGTAPRPEADVLGSDREPRRLPTYRPFPRLPRLGQRGQLALGVLVALALVGAVATLKSSTPSASPQASIPLPVRTPPAYDRLPGRTPIPLPVHVPMSIDVVGGQLPPAPAATFDRALAAANAVLGHYCLHATEGERSVELLDGYRHVLVTAQLAGYEKIAIELWWTVGSYRWQGEGSTLRGCP